MKKLTKRLAIGTAAALAATALSGCDNDTVSIFLEALEDARADNGQDNPGNNGQNSQEYRPSDNVQECVYGPPPDLLLEKESPGMYYWQSSYYVPLEEESVDEDSFEEFELFW